MEMFVFQVSFREGVTAAAAEHGGTLALVKDCLFEELRRQQFVPCGAEWLAPSFSTYGAWNVVCAWKLRMRLLGVSTMGFECTTFFRRYRWLQLELPSALRESFQRGSLLLYSDTTAADGALKLPSYVEETRAVLWPKLWDAVVVAVSRYFFTMDAEREKLVSTGRRDSTICQKHRAALSRWVGWELPPLEDVDAWCLLQFPGLPTAEPFIPEAFIVPTYLLWRDSLPIDPRLLPTAYTSTETPLLLQERCVRLLSRLSHREQNLFSQVVRVATDDEWRCAKELFFSTCGRIESADLPRGNLMDETDFAEEAARKKGSGAAANRTTKRGKKETVKRK